MPRPSRRPPSRQLDLFAQTTPRLAPGGPSWASSPETTRVALTGLVTRMLVAHAGAEAFEPEGVADDE